MTPLQSQCCSWWWVGGEWGGFLLKSSIISTLFERVKLQVVKTAPDSQLLKLLSVSFRVLSPKDQRGHPDFHQRQKQKQTSVMVWGCSRANSMRNWLAYVWRCYCHGGIYWNCTEKYAAIKMTSFMWSPWLSDQNNTSSYSACATTAWFRRDRMNVLDLPTRSPDLTPIENVWPVMRRRIRQRRPQTAKIWSLVSTETGKKCCLLH